MNIRLSEGFLRCRVRREEFDRLLSGRALALEVGLPGDHVLRVNVRPAALGGWQLASDPTGIWISIPRTELESLAQALPSREGIGQEFETARGSVRVSFEVDVKEKKRIADSG